MSPNAVDLSRLSAAEKLRLIESLWDELASDPSNVPVEDWHKAELDRREAAALGCPEGGSSWKEVKARITGRHAS